MYTVHVPSCGRKIKKPQKIGQQWGSKTVAACILSVFVIPTAGRMQMIATLGKCRILNQYANQTPESWLAKLGNNPELFTE